MKVDVKTGLMTSATNKDEVNTAIRVIGRYFMKEPKSPGQNARGTNAARVVAVDAIIGIATSPVPNLAESSFEYPLQILLGFLVLEEFQLKLWEFRPRVFF